MATESFRRHARRRVDAATSRVYAKLRHRPFVRDAFARVLAVLRPQREELVDAARGFAQFERAWLGVPEDWPAVHGHPLLVVHALADHLFGPYPTPRFLAAAWLGEPTVAALQHRRWFVAHARGQRFRDLSLPIAMTRRMEHLFLRTPDHVPIDRALRRAEVLGLGGSPALADALWASRVGRSFEDPEHWRRAIAWFVRVEDDLDLAQVGPIVDYLHAMRRRELPLRCGVPGMLRTVAAWHASLTRSRSPTATLRWPPSRWNELRVPYDRAVDARPDDRDDDRRLEWRVVELLDSTELVVEGRVMRHCVATYAHRCFHGGTAIWSVRTADPDGHPRRSFLTVEIETRSATIVQVKGPRNSLATGRPLAILRMWAARERLAFSSWVTRELTA